jgi:predicted enzyme related to lactoylglutathione lyase
MRCAQLRRGVVTSGDHELMANVIGIKSVMVYVDDYHRAYEFYSSVLGLVRSVEASDHACFFHIGDNKYGLYLEGGCTHASVDERSTRTSFTLEVNSAADLHAKLREAGVRLVHEAPQEMGHGYWWFQFRDPAGNIIEAISGPTMPL